MSAQRRALQSAHNLPIHSNVYLEEAVAGQAKQVNLAQPCHRAFVRTRTLSQSLLRLLLLLLLRSQPFASDAADAFRSISFGKRKAAAAKPQSLLPLSAPQKLIRKIRSLTDLARLRRQVRPRSQARHVAEARRCSFLQFRSRSSPLFRFRRARGTCYAELIEGARSRHYLVNNQKVDRTATHVRRILRACADGDAGRFRAPFSQPPACTQVRLYTR